MGAYVATFVNLLTSILYIALIGRVILSWLSVGPSNPFYPLVNVVYQITEPILAPIRRVLPKFGMLDFSPMVAIILIGVIRSMLSRLG